MLKYRYTRVWAWSNLPASVYVYEAECDLQCAKCNAIIPVNSYFARKIIKKLPVPHCRKCLPFDIYTNLHKVTIAPRENEYLYVSEV